jgi:four helix bundle protein
MNPPDLKDRTFQFSRRIVRLYVSLPTKTLHQTLGHQLLRSGTSVGANYREAIRGRSKAEFRAKLGDCLKELEETRFWLDLMQSEESSNPPVCTTSSRKPPR